MKTSTFVIGTKVNGSNGQGTITAIITKSTGYVEVTYSGLNTITGKEYKIVKKEMAFNLTNKNGEALKSKPSTEPTGKFYPNTFNANLKSALEAEHGRTGLSLSELKRL